MDLKHKGITWVGNIYQKFESVCQEVDDIVSQDPVKYVEDRVHYVGENVKKFYSGVVQDILPVKLEVQSVAQRGSDSLSTHVKSMTGIEENIQSTLIKQSPTEPEDATTPTKNKPTFTFDKGLDILIEKTSSFSDDEKNNVVSTNKNSEESELTSHCEEKHVEGSSDKNETDGFSQVLAPTLINEDSDDLSIQENEMPWGDKLVSEMASLIETREKSGTNSGLTASSDSQPIESCTVSGDSHEHFSSRIGDNPVEEAVISSHNATANPSTDDHKPMEVGLVSSENASSPTQSYAGCKVCKSINSEAEVIAPCSDIGRSDYSSSNVLDSDMETIDLRKDKLKLADSCVFVDSSALYDISRRFQRNRSYKKKIQDAFNSKRRLAKEYEQLAIWHGDADLESIDYRLQTHLHSTQETYLDLNNSSQTLNAEDSEWELV